MGRQAHTVEQHYTVSQVAELLRLDAATVWRRIRGREIQPVIRLGHRTVRVPASAVNRWLEGAKS